MTYPPPRSTPEWKPRAARSSITGKIGNRTGDAAHSLTIYLAQFNCTQLLLFRSCCGIIWAAKDLISFPSRRPFNLSALVRRLGFPQGFSDNRHSSNHPGRTDRGNRVRSEYPIFGGGSGYDYSICLQPFQKRFPFRSSERPSWSPEGAAPSGI